MGLLSTHFPQRVALAHVDGYSPTKIGERKSGLPVTAVSCAQQRKERLILVDWEKLTITLRPALRREIESHDPNFAKKRFHNPLSFFTC
jgi:hypothetical protein